MSDTIVTTYGFMNLQTGRFLRFSKNDTPFDGEEDHADAWFSKDVSDPIWETDSAAAVLHLLDPWSLKSDWSKEDILSGIGLPSFGWWFDREALNAMHPVAFQRVMRPIVEGGDPVPVAMTVSGVHFETKNDPNSVWLVSLETSEAVKLTP
jgi:hypothetical protein